MSLVMLDVFIFAWPEEDFLKRGVDVNMIESFYGWEDHLTPLGAVQFTDEKYKEPLVRLLLKYGADINKTSIAMESPLHDTIYRDFNRAKLLLEEGADVNLKDMFGSTPLNRSLEASYDVDESILFLNIENHRGQTPLMNCTHEDGDLQPRVLVLLKHVKKLQIAGFPVSSKNKRSLEWNLEQQGEANNFDEADFIKECKSEIDSMSTVKLCKYTTLRDIIFKEPNKMALYVENLDFRQILESEDFTNKFQIYGCLLKLQFRKGLARRKLLEQSQASLKLLSKIEIPNICFDSITQYLINEELKNMIKATSSISR